MALKIRLARHGSKKRPYYRVVVADARSPRDGRYIDHIGHYNPLLAKTDENRVHIDPEKAKAWLAKGARPTERVARFLGAAGLWQWKHGNNPIKGKPGAKALELIEARKGKVEARKVAEEEAKEAAKEAAAAAKVAAAEAAEAEKTAAAEAKEAAKSAPAEEAPAEETPAAETAKEETAPEVPAEEAAKEEAAPEAAAEEKPVEEAPVEEAPEAKAEEAKAEEKSED